MLRYQGLLFLGAKLLCPRHEISVKIGNAQPNYQPVLRSTLENDLITAVISCSDLIGLQIAAQSEAAGNTQAVEMLKCNYILQLPVL